MSQIDAVFATLRNSERKALIPYFTAGDPSLNHTYAILEAITAAGADLIEVGVPFSDPLADGPVIQRASQRALASGTSLSKILALVGKYRRSSEPSSGQALHQRNSPPIVLFSYLNPIWQLGIEKFADQARESGVSGVLVTDLIPEEAEQIKKTFDRCDLDLIFLIAPTSTDERIRKICSLARGFIYAVSRTGTTGTRDSLSGDLKNFIARIRKHTPLPIAVGFGISNREQVATVWECADGAVVGSAIVREIERSVEAHSGKIPTEVDLAKRIKGFVESLIPPRL
ncbi:MAG: tryptophan synthase subunit alpha [Acidobacteriia bacterium]|nr:tryptophan synthase subunit alpha [Terriglobia bacterium]